MIYLVYHYDMEKYCCSLNRWSKMDFDAEAGWSREEDSQGPKFPEEYRAVAAVEADNLEKVFEKTNHIDQDWTENEGVIPMGSRHRSTSVGDIVVDGEGNRVICAGCGWEKI